MPVALHLLKMLLQIRLRPDLPTWQAITDGHWRATFNRDNGEASELFNLVEDPDEANNLIAGTAPTDVLDHLSDALTSTLEK